MGIEMNNFNHVVKDLVHTWAIKTRNFEKMMLERLGKPDLLKKLDLEKIQSHAELVYGKYANTEPFKSLEDYNKFLEKLKTVYGASFEGFKPLKTVYGASFEGFKPGLSVLVSNPDAQLFYARDRYKYDTDSENLVFKSVSKDILSDEFKNLIQD